MRNARCGSESSSRPRANNNSRQRRSRDSTSSHARSNSQRLKSRHSAKSRRIGGSCTAFLDQVKSSGQTSSSAATLSFSLPSLNSPEFAVFIFAVVLSGVFAVYIYQTITSIYSPLLPYSIIVVDRILAEFPCELVIQIPCWWQELRAHFIYMEF
jgi:hypothetical protein